MKFTSADYGFGRPKRRFSFFKLGLPVLAVLALFFAISFSSLTKAKPEAPPPNVMPSVNSFDHQVAGIGVTEPRSENINVGAYLPGVVTEVMVKVGDKVSEGETLFVQDTRDTEAKLRVAKVQAADAEHQLSLYRKVKDKRAISKDELSQREFAAELARARVTELETELDRLHVTAPIDGTVLLMDVRPGEYAPAGQQTNPLLIMGDVSTMHVRVEVDESDALRVSPEAEAVAEVRGYPDKRTKLEFVRKEYYVQPKKTLTGDGNERVDTRVQQIVYAFDNSELGVFVGQQMDVYIKAPPAGKAAP